VILWLPRNFWATDPSQEIFVFQLAAFSMPKQVGELCHAEAFFHRQASEQSLTRLRVCWHVSLDGKRCVRLN